MNKKRELVNTILDAVEAANVKLPEEAGFALDAGYKLGCADPDRYWKRNPNGHSREDATCIEQLLACLDEHSLEDILASGGIPEGIEWNDLWRTWGAVGCFQCVPTIIEDDERIPVLRIRHDSYLSWFRGYAFQNSCDLRANGSNGASNSDLELAVKCVTCPWWDTDEEKAAWESKHALFRKALILSYPICAAGNQQSFYKCLQSYPEVFEDFIARTDKRCLHLDLDTSLTLEKMRAEAAATKFEGPIVEELALVRDDGYGVILRYNTKCVSVSWSEDGENHSLCIHIPEWDKEVYMGELDDIGDMNCGQYPNYPSMQYDLLCCWTGLTITLLALMGGQISYHYWVPTKKLAAKMDKILPSFFSDEKHASDPRLVWDKLYELSRTYPGFKELSQEYLKQ